ncbi:unnamed protein product, partial [marine sediment metagenome]
DLHTSSCLKENVLKEFVAKKTKLWHMGVQVALVSPL